MNLMRAIAAIGGMTMLSRVFGFARDILIATFLGAGSAADAFVVAFRFPNLFRRLFAEGAFAAAFVPIFSKSLEAESREAAAEFANQAFTVLAIALLAFTVVVELLMPWIMYGLAPGFDEVPGKMEMATEFTRIAFPYLLFISLVALQSGVMNSLGRFAAPAAAPVLLNVTLIVAVVGFHDGTEATGRALSWGVFVAGIVQFAWLVWHLRRAGFPVRFVRPRLPEKVRTLGKRILPVVFGASLYQINLLIGTILASTISDGAVSYLYYADRVTQLPLGVVGIAVGTALLPMLSRQLGAGEERQAMDTQNRGLEVSLLLTLPAAAACIAIPMPIIATLFEHGLFHSTATAATAGALWAFGTGLPAYVLIRVLTPGFFARDDTRTPVKIAAVAMVLNIVLNLALMQVMAHVGIALASSLAAWVNALALGVVLHRRGHFVLDARFRRRFPRIVAATAVMAAALVAAQAALAAPLAGPLWQQASALALLVVGGAAVYGVAAQLLGATSLGELRRLLRRSQSPAS